VSKRAKGMVQIPTIACSVAVLCIMRSTGNVKKVDLLCLKHRLLIAASGNGIPSAGILHRPIIFFTPAHHAVGIAPTAIMDVETVEILMVAVNVAAVTRMGNAIQKTRVNGHLDKLWPSSFACLFSLSCASVLY